MQDKSAARIEIMEALMVILKALVDSPEELSINMMVGEQTTQYRVLCATLDVGKVLGKDGRNIGALRAILNCLAAKHKIRAVIELENC